MVELDAFILYNERETAVQSIVDNLASRGISTHFWRRDIELGEAWEEKEERKLREAAHIVVFLGDAGWGPTHLALANKARQLSKHLIPVLIGNPQEDALNEAGRIFRVLRYVDLRSGDSKSFQILAEAIKRSPTAETVRFDRIISILVDGSDEQRADVLQQVQNLDSARKSGLAARLRTEITERFNPNSEALFAAAIRDPKMIASIRSWMLSCLIWADTETSLSQEVILDHLNVAIETDRNVRYWTLAGIFQTNASYLPEAVKVSRSDVAPEISALARAIASPEDDALIDRFRADLRNADFETAWQVLRLLRIVPIPQLVPDVCALLNRPDTAPWVYDGLYALTHPVMAQEAASFFVNNPDIIVDRVLVQGRNSNRNAIRNFSELLSAFPKAAVESALSKAEWNPATRTTLAEVRAILKQRRPVGQNELIVAGYASDTIDVSQDQLDIREDVQTLTAVMLASEVKPPLAIGLFGDWGSGKSFFMRSMRAAAEKLVLRAKRASNPKFCKSIVQIDFNAWHYVDTNLWASLVNHILEQLAASVTPKSTPEEEKAALVSELGSARALVSEVKAETAQAKDLITNREGELRNLQVERQEKEVRLRDLRASDLQAVLEGNEPLKNELQESLKTIGVPATLESVSDLSQLVTEAHTLRGRITTLFLTLVTSQNRKPLILLLLICLVGVPLATWALHHYVRSNEFLINAGAFAAEVAAVITGATAVVRKAFNKMSIHLSKIEEAKKRVDAIIAAKRALPGNVEVQLQTQIASLKAQEHSAAARLSEAAARVSELEERLLSLAEARSLMRFLTERTTSEDYRKHLGIISIIRKDFESLDTRLGNAAANTEDKLRSVDRIILYIDDLDRCPTEKVMEVLQAVHLILAYPLFVVVVGVDPRWLLHSLGSTFAAFQSDRQHIGADAEEWRTTPQNYLEKIFQIPFSLRSMTETGFGQLMAGLLNSPAPAQPALIHAREQNQASKPVQNAAPVATGGFTVAQEEGSSRDPQTDTIKEDLKTDDFHIDEESLTIQAWETSFAERLFHLIPTPRAAKRFSNIYRLLKAPIPRSRLPRFQGTAEILGEFQVPMFLLGVLIGAPAESSIVFPKLLKNASEGRNPKDTLRRFTSSSNDSNGLNSLQEKILPIIADEDFPDDTELFLEWIPRVSRFSFDVARAIRSGIRITALQS
jgi:hypothetical protein